MLRCLMRTAVALVALCGAASAADIAAAVEDGRTVVHLSGEIDIGDAVRFERAVAGRGAGTVVLSGPGGRLIDALTIGELLHARGDETAVRGGESCTSACALIWIAGVQRTLEDGAAVGFHAASAREGTVVRSTASGNAIVGAYLTRLGFPLAVVVMATEADFTSMAYLTAARAASSGLTYSRGVGRRPGTRSPPAVAEALPQHERDPAGAARPPADATEFVDFYFAGVNAGPNALRTLAGRTYADSIVYFGETVSRAELIRRREDQRRRWPDFRMTRIAPAAITCNPAADLCAISGDATVSGRTEPGTAATSGTVTYELTVVRADGWFRVTSERSVAGGATALATALQRELGRAGCEPGPADGKWGRQSRAALQRFASNSGLALAPDPSGGALAAVATAAAASCRADTREARTAPRPARSS